jgi:DNA-binding response OmpR family regulator
MGHRVLVVEDEEDIAFPLVRTLEREGYDVAWVDNGQKALDELDARTPEVVILDLGLPDIDGIEVCGRLRDCPGGGPAVVLTSSRDASDYPPHFEHCGARGFIAKAELSGDALALLAA